MAGLRKVLITLLVALLIILALVFSMNNQVKVALDFFVYETPAHGIAVWLIGAFVLGALIGMALTSLAMMRVSVKRRQAEKKLNQTEKALQRQRSESAKGL
ncbi:LapA family protein [Marinobacteraceae bacterium S3BR75-40.1]